MARRTRAEMEETRLLLLETARKVFCEQGYAEASMDDLTAQAGLTRGALYHHFGDKKGLLSAVVAQIDAEMDARLQAISDTINDPWQAFTMRCHTYLEMALEPEIQRIIMRDSRAVLSDKLTELPTHCVISMSNMIDYLIENKILVESDSKMLALFIYGSLEATALWIANSSDGETQLEQAKSTLDILLNSLRV
ncbi:TetR/AcrR family transcriptional regulator [Proteus alimentorum]|uniref:TetR/AcrR family transcriptional regulator n=1 Tax=Proteus alimentorum TaxID=1973495 RepID=A0ABS0IRQ0_9GAMM|nr:TetR/AcrR family transcriptional regulator [Proteus alimentorum]MBG2874922.1 TetR/AcrR family transcriptional regulator [Proteus alimentorum]MBG2878697.1 TetR/AcrR family transcriptional regulator [Proteus alimentorum]